MITVLLVISILFQLQPAVSLRGEGQRGRGARQVSGTYMCAVWSYIYIINSNYLSYICLQGESKKSGISKSMYIALRALKIKQINFNPVHVFLHFWTFGLMVLQLILASKLSQLEQFEIFWDPTFFDSSCMYTDVCRYHEIKSQSQS